LEFSDDEDWFTAITRRELLMYRTVAAVWGGGEGDGIFISN
tara:strand:- start:156 stop:278 length:123 start_codon:yes stop_codon:yes gene_type:complete